MKLLLIPFCFLFLISCKKETTTMLKPSFLIGDWIRLNDEKGSTTFEKWDTNLKGLGYTLKEKDTTFKETLSIVSIKDTLFLKVSGIHKNATFFKFTEQSNTSFTCENPKNEFPKKIKILSRK